MSRLYQSPYRVYLILTCLALWGIISGIQLPISLFPNSTKPVIYVGVSYKNLTPDEFKKTYGDDLEAILESASFSDYETEAVTAEYNPQSVDFLVTYKWGTPPVQAHREVDSLAKSYAAQMPLEMRNSVRVRISDENSGFLAVSYFSSKRGLDDVFKIVDPLLSPRLAKIKEAQGYELFNPNRKEIRVELNPEKLALLQLMPSDVANVIEPALRSYGAGNVTVGIQSFMIALDRHISSLEHLGDLPIPTNGSQAVHLRDIATVDFGPASDSNRIMKTSGMPSLILFASPRPGGNIKEMAEKILAEVRGVAKQLPPDIEYRVLVDPSEFIRSAVNNVLHEVFLAALLAVVVLFVFIGNFRNVMTAAIEIPMSIVLAFILMRWFGINLNLISLGGLALSAGMNVDASVVVMENIFRHFDEWKGPLGKAERFRLVMNAVNEVKFPIIASTIASLVVFLPLALTSGLTNALLGDLASAVVFSHGFSAFVALILVPTVRLHLMSDRRSSAHSQSPIEGQLRRLESFYGNALSRFMRSKRLKGCVYGGVIAALIILFVFVLPRLPKEIVGTPDTDWIILMTNTSGNTMIQQMEVQSAEVESKLLEKLGDKIQYTFTQVHGPNESQIMARLKDKHDMEKVWKAIEAEFPNTPFLRFTAFPWNPSELPIPNPDDLRIVVRGNDAQVRADIGQDIRELIEGDGLYQGVWNRPSTRRRERIVLKPDPERWSAMHMNGVRLTTADIADMGRVATLGRPLGEMPIDNVNTTIMLRYPKDRVKTVEDLAALPVGIRGKLLPLGALTRPVREFATPFVYQEDGKELVLVSGKLSKEDKNKIDATLLKTSKLLDDWKKTKGKDSTVSVTMEDSRIELTQALEQLGVAVGLSILLIFLTMVLQFGDAVNALLVLVAIPLGFIGVLISLYVFGSTLSLNSVLGVILLNGISVANSIILVDFLKRLVDAGREPFAAAIEAAQKRMRPILMTSLTTGLGMMPVAIGMGEGGKILQPLGIAVVGGLGFSVLMTLFLVPSLQVSYLTWKQKRERSAVRRRGLVPDAMGTKYDFVETPNVDDTISAAVKVKTGEKKNQIDL